MTTINVIAAEDDFDLDIRITVDLDHDKNNTPAMSDSVFDCCTGEASSCYTCGSCYTCYKPAC